MTSHVLSILFIFCLWITPRRFNWKEKMSFICFQRYTTPIGFILYLKIGKMVVSVDFRRLLPFSANCHLSSEHCPTAGWLVTTEVKALEGRKEQVSGMGEQQWGVLKIIRSQYLRGILNSKHCPYLNIRLAEFGGKKTTCLAVFKMASANHVGKKEEMVLTWRT